MTNSVLLGDKDNDDSKAPAEVSREKSNTTPYLSTVRARGIANKDFIDYKTLREEERTDTFDLYLNQKKGDIIQSIKIYFSIRSDELKLKEINSQLSEKERFLTDLTNLLHKTLNIENTHFSVLENFVKKVI